MAIRKQTVPQVVAPKVAIAPPAVRSETQGGGTISSLTPATTSARAPEIAFGQIAERAHQIYLQRGFGPGDAASDWLEAERQLKAGL